MAQVRTTTRVLVLPDVHTPLHDEKAIDIVLRFKKDFKPHITIAGGDFVDAQYVSLFAKDLGPHDQWYEFEVANQLLDKLRPDIYLEGNHEERFFRAGNIPQEYRRLLDPRHWLQLKQRGIQWVPYDSRKVYRLGKLAIVHGFSTGLNAGRKHATTFGPVVFGHSHRLEQGGVYHKGECLPYYNIGCLCAEQDYGKNKIPPPLERGFGFGIIRKGGDFDFYAVRIAGKAVYINGKEYKL